MFFRKKKKNLGKSMERELDLCIFDCIIKQSVFMYVVARGQALSRTAILNTSLLTFKVVSSGHVFFIINIYKSIFKYINFIFHPSCAICCVELSFIVSNHAINKGPQPFFFSNEEGGLIHAS